MVYKFITNETIEEKSTLADTVIFSSSEKILLMLSSDDDYKRDEVVNGDQVMAGIIIPILGTRVQLSSRQMRAEHQEELPPCRN